MTNKDKYDQAFIVGLSIDVSLLTIQEKKWLNNYHETVCLNFHRKLDSNEARWLHKVTKPL